MKNVNQPFRKKDAMQLVTGKPVYMDDLAPADCLIVKLLRSPHPNAIVKTINTTVAKKVPGIDASTGSLGQGCSIAVGMALGAKHAGKGLSVYAIVGDGEVEEGECWEAFMFAAHYGLSNLCVFLDRNHLQIDGTTETVMNSAPLEEKLKAFNFNVLTINGHDLDAIESAIAAFHAENEKPTCIILDTLKGKGVSFMENAVDWHGKGPNDEEYEIAMKELNAAYAALEEEDK